MKSARTEPRMNGARRRRADSNRCMTLRRSYTYDDRTTAIYFVQEVESGAIKVGYAADPVARLRGLQVGNPRELILIARVEAPLDLERRLHSLLSPHRIIGEWYEPVALVLEAMEFCVEEYGQPPCPECDREARYVAAGYPPPTARAYIHNCGRRP